MGREVFNQGFIGQCFLCHQIGSQHFISLMPVVNHHGLFYLRMGSEGVFNFAQLNAVTADFDLKIIAPEIFQIAVRPPAHQITGFVQAGIAFRLVFGRREWVRHKTLSSQFRPVPVTPRQSRTADVQFSRCADRSRMAAIIKNIETGIVDALADGSVPVL
ncbi:hypothetical protein Xenpb_02590 [Xenorhabdus sp. PB62.4]|nr:hypothetical protein [Xenorhabdus sp. PB62.4]